MGIRVGLTLFLAVTMLFIFGMNEDAFARGPITITPGVDSGRCDSIPPPTSAHELGVGFPPTQLIGVDPNEENLVSTTACPDFDSSTFNVDLEIVNLSLVSYGTVWYVGDPDTFFTNSDYTLSGDGGGPVSAFRIDAAYCDAGGNNLPLIFESGPNDCVFAPGETWRFIIQDFSSSLQASSLASPMVPSSGEEQSVISSGSIIAVPVSDGSQPVGGEIIPLDTSMILLAGTQMTAAWLIPAIVSVVGISLVLARKF